MRWNTTRISSVMSSVLKLTMEGMKLSFMVTCWMLFPAETPQKDAGALHGQLEEGWGVGHTPDHQLLLLDALHGVMGVDDGQLDPLQVLHHLGLLDHNLLGMHVHQLPHLDDMLLLLLRLLLFPHHLLQLLVCLVDLGLQLLRLNGQGLLHLGHLRHGLRDLVELKTPVTWKY